MWKHLFVVGLGHCRRLHCRRAVEKRSKRQAPFQSLGHGESRLFTTRMSKFQNVEMRNKRKIRHIQSNGVSEFKYDQRATVALQSVTPRNNWWLLPEKWNSSECDRQRIWRGSRHLLVEGRLFLEVIDKWKSVEACNCNKVDQLNFDREDEESQLWDRLRNLKITPNDDGCMGLTGREAEELQWWSGRALDMERACKSMVR